MAHSTDLGLDTSVVLRLLTGQPAKQARVAAEAIRTACAKGYRVIVSDLVVAESYFALQTAYHVPKKDVLKALGKLFSSGTIQGEDGGCAAALLTRIHRYGSKPGFVDRLIHAQYHRSGLSLLSFEKATKRLDGTRVLYA